MRIDGKISSPSIATVNSGPLSHFFNQNFFIVLKCQR